MVQKPYTKRLYFYDFFLYTDQIKTDRVLTLIFAVIFSSIKVTETPKCKINFTIHLTFNSSRIKRSFFETNFLMIPV